MGAYVPPGWPEDVRPPGSGDFEGSAVAWLLDVVPPEYRQYGVLRRHPAAAAYRKEGFRLAATSRSVELVERALRGETFPDRFLARAAGWTGLAYAPVRPGRSAAAGCPMTTKIPRPMTLTCEEESSLSIHDHHCARFAHFDHGSRCRL